MNHRESIHIFYFFLLFCRFLYGIEIIVIEKKSSKAEQEVVIVDEISNKNIKELQLSTIGEVLDILPYIHTEKIGDRYSQNSFFIRGLSFEKTAILINGIKLPILQTQILSLYEPINWEIKKIEIYKGGESVLFGEGALAGAINIVFKKPKNKLQN